VEGEAAAAVLSALDGDAYARLRSDLDDLLQDPPLTKRAARPARKELPAHVARAARRLARAVDVAVDPNAAAHDRDIAVHEARKAGKRLRYATEVARPAVGKDAKRFAKELKGFQDALGEHQDTVVAREALRHLAVEAHGDGGNGFAFGVLYGRDAARAARIEEELPDLWAQAWRRRNRRWLG
jgi:CHAD domain-containing protein